MADGRTLFEIIDGAKAGEKPTHDECYYAMLALDALHSFTSRELRAHGRRPEKLRQMFVEEDFQRTKRALGVNPRTWLGDRVPENPDYQRDRRLAIKLYEKVTEENRDDG